MRAVAGLWLSVSLAGCAANPSPAAPEAATGVVCRRTLSGASAPRAASAPPAAPVAPPSRLIVEAQLPLARLSSELERAVAPRLAAASGVRIGPAGVVHYAVDRGAFAISAANGQLVIETPLQGRAEACSGRRCYASCEPAALARAELPLWLRPDYRFERARVSLSFTRGCKVRALGGLLSADVTPLLRSALAPQLERVGAEIDRRLPDLRAHVERAWRQLSQPRSLPLVGCLEIAPLGLVQGPMVEANGLLQARFALLARPELRGACSAAPAPSAPLPPLTADPALPPEDVLTLGMETPLAGLARAFEAAAPEAEEAASLKVTRAQVEARGSDVLAELTLAGELCGTVALQAEPAFMDEDGVITLRAGKLDDGESARVRAAGGDPGQLARRLAQRPRLAPLLPLPVLRSATPALASLLSDPELELSARLSSLRAAGAAARGEQLVTWVEARGSLLLRPVLAAAQ